MTLRARVALFVAAAVGLAVALVSIAAYRSTRDETVAQIDAFLLSRAPLAVVVDDPVIHVPGSGQGSGRPRQLTVVGEDVAAQILFSPGTVTVLGNSDFVLPFDDTDLAIARGDHDDLARTIDVAGVRYRLLTTRLGPATALMVARDLSETEHILEGLRNRLVLIGVGGALLAGIAGWLLAGSAVRPVRDLTAAAEAVATTGALDAAIPVGRSDEIGRLAGAFNEMLARLESMRASQQRLVADASHELRTPLTSLRTNIELLGGGKVPESERPALLSDLTAEVAELGSLVGELVDLATVGRADEERVETDLAGLVADAVARASRRATQAIDFRSEPVSAVVRPGAVARAVGNLLDNAVKWSPPTEPIGVVLDASGLTVADRGPGIDPADLPFVFRRFYRATAARSMPGSGLGLAIVAAVAEDHSWIPFARNRDGGGAEVGLRFS